MKEKGGNKFIYGLIDYDNKKTTVDNLKVLGGGNRYAIENYILDPILLAIFLLKRSLVTAEELGLESGINFSDSSNFESDKLQNIANEILKIIILNCVTDSEEIITCQLYNNKQIEMPKWFLNYQGHQLKKSIIKSFAGLEKLTNPKKKLKMSIITEVISIFPGLTSIDVVETLKDLQS